MHDDRMNEVPWMNTHTHTHTHSARLLMVFAARCNAKRGIPVVIRLDSGPKFTGLLSPNAGGIVLDHVFPILDILSRSGNIRDQIRKLCKIAPNFACSWSQNFFRGGPLIFGLPL